MRKVLLISPHFDDAILSAGQFMAGRPDTEVVTVFAGFPKEDTSTPYDLNCGFKSSNEAVSARRYEDRTATAFLNATHIHLDFTDEQYGDEYNEEEVKEALYEIVKKEDYEFILAPLGLGHPDHIVLADLIRSMKFKIPVYFWEDLPLRVVDPLLVPPRLKAMKLTKLAQLGDGAIADKIRALSCYKSQIGTGILNPYVMYVPERFWE